MSHVACKWGNWVDSWLLMVGSQFASLTPNLSFGHNLCYKCSNGRCEPIWDIYALITFQWYKELLKSMSFDSCNRALKTQESIRDSNSQPGSSLRSVRVHALTLFALLGVCDVIFRSFSWPAPLQPLCFGREPKVRVTTQNRRLSHIN
jgi:hypothetical protein